MSLSRPLERNAESEIVGWIVRSKPPFWRQFVWPDEAAIITEYEKHPDTFSIEVIYN